MDSTITLIGNLTREPELRFIPSGQATANFGIAVNRRWQDKATSEWKEETSFFDVVAWGTLAENVCTLARGTRVIVTGRLTQRSWETQEGERRSKVEVSADAIGPDLRWASVTVAKNERRSGGTPVANQPAPAAKAAKAAPAYDDQEPF